MLVSKYATPLAIFLVVMGLWLSQAVGAVRNGVAALLLFSIAFNGAVVWRIRRGGGGVGLARARLVINFAVNVALVYLVGQYWDSIWLLLVLTPVAAAIYGSRLKTLLISLGTSAALIVIHALHGSPGASAWGEDIARSVFIVALSLMVNEYVRKGD